MGKDIADMTISEINTSISDLKTQLSMLEKKLKIEEEKEKDRKLLAEYNFYQEIIDNGYTYQGVDISEIEGKIWERDFVNKYYNKHNKYICQARNICSEYRKNEIRKRKEEKTLNWWQNLLGENNLPLNEVTLEYKNKFTGLLLTNYTEKVNKVLSLYSEIQHYPNFNIKSFLDSVSKYAKNFNIKIMTGKNIKKTTNTHIKFNLLNELSGYFFTEQYYIKNKPYNTNILIKMTNIFFERLFRENIILTKDNYVYSKIYGTILLSEDNGEFFISDDFLTKLFNTIMKDNNEPKSE